MLFGIRKEQKRSRVVQRQDRLEVLRKDPRVDHPLRMLSIKGRNRKEVKGVRREVRVQDRVRRAKETYPWAREGHPWTRKVGILNKNVAYLTHEMTGKNHS